MALDRARNVGSAVLISLLMIAALIVGLVFIPSLFPSLSSSSKTTEGTSSNLLGRVSEGTVLLVALVVIVVLLAVVFVAWRRGQSRNSEPSGVV